MNADTAFWNNVQAQGGHWLWAGPMKGGIPYTRGRSSRNARVLAYTLKNGRESVPSGYTVLLLPGEPMNCVNPEHATVVSKSVLSRHGEDHPNHKLNDSAVLTILRLLDAGSSQTEVAEAIGVSQPTVSRIRRGIDWKHLTEKRNDAHHE